MLMHCAQYVNICFKIDHQLKELVTTAMLKHQTISTAWKLLITSPVHVSIASYRFLSYGVA